MKRSKIETLTPALRAEIDTLLIARGFAGYEALEQEILDAHGLNIGKSTLHRYGQRLERRMAAIQASTEAARAIAEAAPDDADQRSAAVISLVQSELFESMLSLQDATDEDDPAQRVQLLASAARAIAEAARASVGQKKWAETVRKATREQAAAAATKIAKKKGVSKDTQDLIRREILGLSA